MLSRLLVVLYFAFSVTFIECVTAESPVASEGQECNPSGVCTSNDPISTKPPQPTQTFGLTTYKKANFLGQEKNNVKASVNASIPLEASFQLFGKIWAAMSSSSGNNSFIIWDSVPDVANLPIQTSQDFAITDIQSLACSPPCSGSGFCSDSSGKCQCPKGFDGTLCENCASKFFGPKCQPCPSNCTDCDQGITGTGRCLDPIVSSSACTSKKTCTCPPGYALDGTACTKCEQGFFMNSAGSCQVCQLGCAECASGTGNCESCKEGFTKNSNDTTRCDPGSSLTSGGQVCPPGAFSDAQRNCSACSPSCLTCNGPSSANCLTCRANQAMFDTSCVDTDSDGTCAGTNGLIANNINKRCETCGTVTPNCAKCGIQDFNVASTLNNAQCTKCLPGYFLANVEDNDEKAQGTCVRTCPAGSFQDNNSTSCTKCSPSCGTCAGDSNHCTACKEGYAHSGECISTCPSGTFATSNHTCVNCHPDCHSCQGSSFDQCTSCSRSLPVLSSGRCLPTCGNQTQFFDTTTSKCQDCDQSCMSCSGSGPNQCLACRSQSILEAGECVPVPTLARRLPTPTQTTIIP